MATSRTRERSPPFWHLGPGFTPPLLLIERFPQHLFADIYGDSGGDRQCNRVAGSAIHFDEFPIPPDPEPGEVRVLFQVTDDDILDLPTQLLHHRCDEVVGERPGGLHALDPPLDAGRFEDPDHNWEATLPFHFFQDDHLVVVHLVDDDPTEFHLNRHSGLPASRQFPVSSFLLEVYRVRETVSSPRWACRPPEAAKLTIGKRTLMSTILFSTLALEPTEELRRAVAQVGFRAAKHQLGSAPGIDFGPVAVAVIEVGDRAEVAAAQTRRWRIELGDDFVPILWILPAESADLATLGLESGADACLSQPVPAGVFVAQVKAMARGRITVARVGVKATEARLLGDQLRKAYAQLDGELEMARRVHRTFLPRTIPEIGAARVSVCYRPRSRVGGDFFDVRRLDETHLGFFLGDVIGRGTAAGSLLGVFIKQVACLKEITGSRYRLVPPDEVLAGVNRELIGLGMDDPPLVAMLVGLLDVKDGAVSVARAGSPAPVYIPRAADATNWAIPGPFLGTAEAGYQPTRALLSLGDKLVIGSDGTRPDGGPAPGSDPDQLRDVATRRRGLSGQAFVDAMARDLLPHVRHPDDFTLLAVEMTS